MQPGKKGWRLRVKGFDMDEPNKSRRSFLKIGPLGIVAGVFASIGSAAFRFRWFSGKLSDEQMREIAEWVVKLKN